MADSYYGYGTPFDSKEQEEQRQKWMKEENEKMKTLLGSCSHSIYHDGYQPAYTCASINKDVCIPSPISDSKSRNEKMFDQLANESKKLIQEKFELNLKVMKMQKQIRDLTDDKNKYKAFAEAEKGKVWKDLNESIKSIYQKIVDWFNT